MILRRNGWWGARARLPVMICRLAETPWLSHQISLLKEASNGASHSCRDTCVHMLWVEWFLSFWTPGLFLFISIIGWLAVTAVDMLNFKGNITVTEYKQTLGYST